jgi:hypothetical protein
MRAKLEVTLLLGTMGLSAAFAVSGCGQVTPECSNIDADVVLLEGISADHLRCLEGSDTKCDPSQNPAEAPDDRCGVFVSTSGSDETKGTKAEPVRTIAKALELLPKTPPTPTGGEPSIYLCAESIEEEVTVVSKARIYGGLDCKAQGAAAWLYDSASKTVLTAPEGKVPLRLSGGEEIFLHDMYVRAAPVTSMGMAGVSSIAVIADGATATFSRSVIEAGDGVPGKAGDPYMTSGANGEDGAVGNASCSVVSGPVVGGSAKTNICSTGTGDSVSGDGGPGSTTAGFTGATGTPGESINPNGGAGATAASVCAPGLKGTDGGEGLPGADASGLGILDPTAGYIGVSGEDGKPGAPGQGGGGGGGSKATAAECSNGMLGGASGGSGASGGCGGDGGRGGSYGGSSIAIVSIASTLTFSVSTIKLGNGGAPGSGGTGQSGGLGGVTGGLGGMATQAMLKSGCTGGPGGNGGAGGKGGKGLGGHAIGIAFAATQPKLESIVFHLGVAGEGGLTKDVQEFPPQ